MVNKIWAITSTCVPIPLQLPQHKVHSPKDIVTRIRANVDNHNSCHQLNPIVIETTSIANTSIEPGLDRLSKQEQASRVIEEGKISVDTKLHTFTVMGSTCPHLVTLIPRKFALVHILAAKLAVGQRLDDSKKKINLTQFHRNRE